MKSTFVDPDDWEITDKNFPRLQKWGPFNIARFANESTHKVRRFNSRFHCKNTEGVDVFAWSWETENNLLVPPVSEIIRPIRKLAWEKVRGTLILPFWKSAAFSPFLLADPGIFKSFVKDKAVFQGRKWLPQGNCKFSLLGSHSFTSAMIALHIQS